MVKDRLRNVIKGFKNKPMIGDIRSVEGYKDGRLRLRIGSYRVIFRKISEEEVDIIFIMEIGNRGDIYKCKGAIMSTQVLEAASLMESLPIED